MNQNKKSSQAGYFQIRSEYIEEFIKICIIAAAIIVPVRFFLIQPFYVKGASMEPTFREDEYLIVDELSYRFRQPTRGEVIVFRYPKTERRFLIKRVIGLPGERISIKGSKITVFNKDFPKGLTLDEGDYLDVSVRTGDFEVTLEKGQYFVLGDNREVSLDSERFGPIDADQIVGRVMLRGYPLARAEVFTAPVYPQ